MKRRDFAHANNPDFACAESVLLLPFGRRSFLPAIVDTCGGEAVTLDETTDREVFRLTAAPSEITLVFSGMGSPAAANALEMVAVAGAQRVVVFGACGGVVTEVGVGELVVAGGGVRGEGTSAYYAPPGFPAAFDPLLTARLWEVASASDVPAHRGVVYTNRCRLSTGTGDLRKVCGPGDRSRIGVCRGRRRWRSPRPPNGRPALLHRQHQSARRRGPWLQGARRSTGAARLRCGARGGDRSAFRTG